MKLKSHFKRFLAVLSLLTLSLSGANAGVTNIIPFGPFIIISGIIYYFCAESIYLLLKV